MSDRLCSALHNTRRLPVGDRPVTTLRTIVLDLAIHIACALIGVAIIGPWIVRTMGVPS